MIRRQPGGPPPAPSTGGSDLADGRLEQEVAHLAFMALAADRLAAKNRSVAESQRTPAGWDDRLANLTWTITAVQTRLRRLAE